MTLLTRVLMRLAGFCLPPPTSSPYPPTPTPNPLPLSHHYPRTQPTPHPPTATPAGRTRSSAQMPSPPPPGSASASMSCATSSASSWWRLTQRELPKMQQALDQTLAEVQDELRVLPPPPSPDKAMELRLLLLTRLAKAIGSALEPAQQRHRPAGHQVCPGRQAALPESQGGPLWLPDPRSTSAAQAGATVMLLLLLLARFGEEHVAFWVERSGAGSGGDGDGSSDGSGSSSAAAARAQEGNGGLSSGSAPAAITLSYARKLAEVGPTFESQLLSSKFSCSSWLTQP